MFVSGGTTLKILVIGGNAIDQPRELDCYVISLYQGPHGNLAPSVLELDEQQWLDFCGVINMFNNGDTPEDLDRNITLVIGAKT